MRADILYLYIDGNHAKKWNGVTSVSYTFTTRSYLCKYFLKVVGVYHGTIDTDSSYLRLKFIPPGGDPYTWYGRTQDYARSPGSSLVWDVAYKILSRYNGEINSASEASYAFHEFGKYYFVGQYEGGDGDSLTASETATYFSNFDGVTPTSRKFDCSDMAAFLSGMATAIGIPSRMISVAEKFAQQYNQAHMIVELYGRTLNGNKGWFLIDPGADYSYYSSYDQPSKIRTAYAGADDGNDLNRLEFIWGMSSSGWGKYVSSNLRTLSWFGFERAPVYSTYSSNP